MLKRKLFAFDENLSIAFLEFQFLWNITEVPCTGPTTFHTTDAKQSCSIDIISIMVGYIFESTGLSTWEKKILQGNVLHFSCMQLKSKTLQDKKLTNL